MKRQERREQTMNRLVTMTIACAFIVAAVGLLMTSGCVIGPKEINVGSSSSQSPTPAPSVAGRSAAELRADNAALRAQLVSAEQELAGPQQVIDQKKAQKEDLKRQREEVKKERDRYKKMLND